VIKSFRHAGLERFFKTDSKAGIQPDHAHKLRLQLTALNEARQPSDLATPLSWGLHRLQGSELHIHDLNSTNGTFINGQQITGEAPLKPGQILRLGQIELRLEMAAHSSAAPAAPSRPAAPSAGAKSPPKKLPDQTMVIPQGVKLGQEHGTKPPFENTAFAKKSNTGTMVFVGVAIAVGVIVVVIIAYHILTSSGRAS